MNSAVKHAIAALLVISIAGCAEKKAKVTPPAQAQAPPADAGKAGALYPPPLVSSQPETQPAAAPAPTVATVDTPPPPPAPAPKPKKPASSRKPKTTPAKTATGSTTAESADSAPATPVTAPPPSAPPTPAQTEAATEMAAAAGEPAAASPIGQLSTGGAAGQSQTHKATSDLIANTENGVNAIKRSLTPQEQETVSQIKAFLLKARQALDNDDYDGASTLATKAKVLLDELNKD